MNNKIPPELNDFTFNDRMKELELVAEKLARSLGHKIDCKKLDQPCTCGSGKQQAEALTNYQRLKRDSV